MTKGGMALSFRAGIDWANSRSLQCAPPDFLSRLAALVNFMRLSLKESCIRCRCECGEAGNLGTLRSKNISRKGPRNCRSLRYPGFPVGLGGVGRSHVPFLKRKAHTRLCPVPRGRKSGFASVLMTQKGGWVSIGDRLQGSQVSKARPGAPFDCCRHSELSNCTPDSPTEFAAPNEQTKSVVPHLRRSIACPMDPALPGWADFWCRPSGPGLQTPLSHVHCPLNLPRSSQRLGMTKGEAVSK
jgi:hypothetical protein